LIDILKKMNYLQVLKIRTTATDKQITDLKSILINCEIITGIYADY